jgi:hypothetical protein
MSVLNHPFYAEASHPLTPQTRLAELAAAYPELHPAISTNPACYPALLEWMRAHGTLAPVAEQQPVVEQPVAEQPVAKVAQPVVAASSLGPQPVDQPNPFGQAAPAPQPMPRQADPANPFSQAAVKAKPAIGTKPLLIGGAIALVVLLIGGGTWAYAAIFSKLGGASTPQAAVEKLLNGAADLDPLSVYGALSPAEVESFRASFGKRGARKL